MEILDQSVNKNRFVSSSEPADDESFSILRYKTVGMVSPQRKPRVFFSCPSEDFAEYFDAITDRILQNVDAAVWYYPADAEAADDRRREVLAEMRLIVMPVTARLLRQPNQTAQVDLPYAIHHGIPVLPIMAAAGLEKEYAGIFGKLQYLDIVTKDQTALRFDQKLAAYLRDVLVSEKLRSEIRTAFDAYIFLSYRKKDRRSVRALMEEIHANPFFRDVAIWYDEYLVAGENFSDAISEAMQNSQLFTLAVTPNLVCERNYVMTTEFPQALKLNMPIVAVELEPTSSQQLEQHFKGLGPLIAIKDKQALAEAIKAGLKTIALQSNDDPQHQYYIGMAYLNGIDVEVNHQRAVQLLTAAAQGGCFAAMDRLGSMYFTGDGVAIDYDESVAWRKKMVEAASGEYALNNAAANRKVYENALEILIAALDRMMRLDEAKEYLDRQLQHYLSVTMTPSFDFEAHYGIAKNKLQSGYIFLRELGYDKALQCARETAAAAREAIAKLAVQSGAPGQIQKMKQALLAAYSLGADTCAKARFNEKDKESAAAKNYAKTGISCSEQMISVTAEMMSDHPQLQEYRNLAAAHVSLANSLVNEKEFEKAEEHLKKADEIADRLLSGGDRDRKTLTLQHIIQGSFGVLRSKEGRYDEAFQYFSVTLKLLRSLGDNFGYPEKLRISIIMQLYNMAAALFNGKKAAQAVGWLEEAIDMCDKMQETAHNPDAANWKQRCTALRARCPKTL